MEDVISKVYDEVRRRCMAPSNAYGIGAWDHHIEVVYRLAVKYAKEYGAGADIVALAALLHDVASVTDKKYTKEHHVIGAKIAEDILNKYDVAEEKIELIKSCVLHHRGSRLAEKNTPEEICVADADAMAHFYSVPSLLRMVYVEKEMSIDEGADFVLQKLERSYAKLSKKGKKLVAKEYRSAKILLKKPDF